jgi:TatA/E family protein of Tat protein translocase
MLGLGTKEILIIAVVLVVLFGSKRIPMLAKDIADAFKNLTGMFKSADKSIEDTNQK